MTGGGDARWSRQTRPYLRSNSPVSPDTGELPSTEQRRQTGPAPAKSWPGPQDLGLCKIVKALITAFCGVTPKRQPILAQAFPVSVRMVPTAWPVPLFAASGRLRQLINSRPTTGGHLAYAFGTHRQCYRARRDICKRGATSNSSVARACRKRCACATDTPKCYGIKRVSRLTVKFRHQLVTKNRPKGRF